MKKWKDYKNVRKLYKEDGNYIIFVYYNRLYSRQTVSLVNMLFKEVQKDFPKKSADDIHIKMLKKFPFEVVLEFSYLKSDVKYLDMSKFKKMPKNFF